MKITDKIDIPTLRATATLNDDKMELLGIRFQND